MAGGGAAPPHTVVVAAESKPARDHLADWMRQINQSEPGAFMVRAPWHHSKQSYSLGLTFVSTVALPSE